MDTNVIIAIAGGAVGVALLVVLAVAWGRRRADRQARYDAVRDEFGAEFDRRADAVGSDQAADELEAKAERLAATDIDRIGPDERAELTERWTRLQHDFVDSPTDAVRRADVLVTEVMRRRNLPVGSIDDRMTAIASIDGDLAVRMRSAHDLFVATESGAADDAGLEEFRAALLTYQSTFEAVLDRPTSEQSERVDRRPADA